MPIIRRSEWTKREDESAPGLELYDIVDAAQGSHDLKLGEVGIPPMTRVPRHIHTNTEEVVIVLEGEVEALVGSQRMVVEPGHVVLAPAGTVHGFVNLSESPARLLYVFPIHEPDRVLTTPSNALPSGFPSEQGLTGYTSPHDRPLGDRPT